MPGASPAEFVGYVPRRMRVAFMLAIPVCLFALMAQRGLVRLVRDVARALEFVSVDSVRFAANALVVSSPALALLFAIALASRRSARATITADHALIRPLRLPWPVLTIPLVDVVARRTTPHGLILVAPAAVPRPLSWLLAPLVPACTPEEQARAHAALDAPHVRAGASFVAPAGRVAGWIELVLLLLLPIAWCLAAESYRFVLDDEVLRLHGLGAALVVVLVVLGAPPRRRVHLGAEALSVGGRVVAWDEVVAIARAGPWFTVETRRHRRAARIRAAEAARLADAARERLARDGREAIVLGTAPRWLRRRRWGLVAVMFVVVAIGVALGPVRYRTKERTVHFRPDIHGQQAIVVARRFDGAPRLVVLVEGGPQVSVAVEPSETADVVVDAPRGRVRAWGREHAVARGATVVHVRRDGVRASTASLGPASQLLRHDVERGGVTSNIDGYLRPTFESSAFSVLLARFPGTQDPFLRDPLAGVTSARCVTARDTSYKVITLKIEPGRRLVSLVIEDERMPRGGRASGLCPACGMATLHPGRAVRLSGGEVAAEADLPAVHDAMRTLVAIGRGQVTVDDTARSWGLR